MEAKKYVIVAVTILLSLGVVGKARGADDFMRSTLVGLAGVHVGVDVHKEAEREGLPRTTLQTDIELRLRKAGIRVLTLEEVKEIPGLPLLSLVIGTQKNPIGIYAYHLALEVWQSVSLLRDPSILTQGLTWRASGVTGTVGDLKLSGVREYVQDKVDEFINDYLAANPSTKRSLPQYIPPGK